MEWKMLILCMAIWNILHPFGIFPCRLVLFISPVLVHFTKIIWHPRQLRSIGRLSLLEATSWLKLVDIMPRIDSWRKAVKNREQSNMLKHAGNVLLIRLNVKQQTTVWRIDYLQTCWGERGCQMVYFRTKNSNLGKLCRLLQLIGVGICYVCFVYLTDIWYFCGNLVYFVVIWYIFLVLVFCSKKNLATLEGRGTLM
jgi:hypothetical protein